MKFKPASKILLPLVIGCFLFLTPSWAQIANSHPGDDGISDDPDVLFAEMAEETTLSELFSNWSANSTANSIFLDNSTSPPNSPGNQSIKLFTTAGTVQNAVLKKSFPAISTDTIYARWYVKYNTMGTFHHSGPRLGGVNPLIPPPVTAGVKPTGADFFSVGAETTQGKTAPVTQSTFDYYTYWMHQHHNSFFPPNTYYGNSFINNPAVFISTSTWNCIEVRLILNHPVTAFNGELAMWINGVLVSDIKTGTLGFWNEDNFTPNPAGTPFEGFQWRNNSNLTFNYFQLQHFVDNDPPGHVNSINYDHIVVAKKYIGPIYNSPLPVELVSFSGYHKNGVNHLNWSTASEIQNEKFEIWRSSNGLEFEKIGEVPGQGNSNQSNAYTFNDSDLLAGLYYYRLRQVDFDGQFKDSEVIALRSESRSFKVYPNPATSMIHFSETLACPRVYNALGSLVLAKTEAVDDLSIVGLPVGVYFLQANDRVVRFVVGR